MSSIKQFFMLKIQFLENADSVKNETQKVDYFKNGCIAEQAPESLASSAAVHRWCSSDTKLSRLPGICITDGNSSLLLF